MAGYLSSLSGGNAEGLAETYERQAKRVTKMYENPYQYLSGNIGDKKLIRAGFEEKLYDTGQVC